ncbi:Scr1 family TA system antitoxin-like transcriptional regulator [Thermomonospora amylolytica]|uniref:Scr1 family TA system antitoxin-like transcriptional regulator n=1 Tax=Thermomonospora amylolytica TaxID=1411117 RepID=UPI003899CC7C
MCSSSPSGPTYGCGSRRSGPGTPGGERSLRHPRNPRPRADVVHVELMNRDISIEDDVDVHRHVLAFDVLRNKALPVAETPEYIQRRPAELE